MHYRAVQENWRAPTQHKLSQRALISLQCLNYTQQSGRQPTFTAPRFLPPPPSTISPCVSPPPNPPPTENASFTIPSSFPRLCHLLPFLSSAILDYVYILSSLCLSCCISFSLPHPLWRRGMRDESEIACSRCISFTNPL